jgi:uncharacterized membrane protein
MQMEMGSSHRLTEPTHPMPARTVNKDRLFLLALSFVTLASILIRLYVGSKSFLDFDEWQHVFIASSPRLTDLRYELSVIAHPALFFWMLRGLLRLGHGILLYRLISILSGGASVFLLGLICRKLCRNVAVALCAAASLALSSAAITISTEVRSYQLSVCFALLAFLCYLDLFSPNAGGLPRLLTYFSFAAAMCLALETDYCAAFVLGALIALWMLFALTGREYRANFLLPANRKRLLLCLFSFAVPVLVLVSMYVGTLRKQGTEGYLLDFYWNLNRGETVSRFLARNILNEWNLFSPVSIENTAVFAFVALTVTVAATYLLVFNLRAKSIKTNVQVPSLFAGLIIIELIILSLMDRYPFGGLLRQQYILAPFLVIATFCLVDVLASNPVPILRIGVPVALLGAILIHFAAAAPGLVVRPGWIVTKKDYDAYRVAFPGARAVYLTHFPVISYFMNTDREPRRFVRHIWDVAQIDEYRMGAAGQRTTELFYDKYPELPDLRDASLYRSVVACLRQSGQSQLTLYFFVAGQEGLPLPPDALKRTVIETAASEGLSTSKVVVDGKAVFAGFSLK